MCVRYTQRNVCERKKERETDRQTDRHTNIAAHKYKELKKKKFSDTKESVRE